MLFIRGNIPFKEIKSIHVNNTEGISYRQKKWLLFACYDPEKAHAPKFFEDIGNNVDRLISQYDNIILLGYVNVEPNKKILTNLCDVYS